MKPITILSWSFWDCGNWGMMGGLGQRTGTTSGSVLSISVGGTSYSASSWNSVRSLPSMTTISERDQHDVLHEGRALEILHEQRERLHVDGLADDAEGDGLVDHDRVLHRLGRVLGRGGAARRRGRRAALAGAAGSAPGGSFAVLVCSTDVSHVNDGSARLISSSRCAQM